MTVYKQIESKVLKSKDGTLFFTSSFPGYDEEYVGQVLSDLCRKDITPESAEKDWWVTAVLQCVFELTAAPYMYFKGWRLIDRFSENIDIALYPEHFPEEDTRTASAIPTVTV